MLSVEEEAIRWYHSMRNRFVDNSKYQLIIFDGYYYLFHAESIVTFCHLTNPDKFCKLRMTHLYNKFPIKRRHHTRIYHSINPEDFERICSPNPA